MCGGGGGVGVGGWGVVLFFFFQAEDGIRDWSVIGVQTCALPICSPGSRAKADARRNAQVGKFSSGSTIIPGADALLPQNTHYRYHQNAPLSCKPRVKLADGPFQGDEDNNQPPPENGNFDESQYKGGRVLLSINLITTI